MPFDITAFRASLKKGGARPNLFEVVLNAPAFAGLDSQQFSFMCHASSHPQSTVGSYKLPYFGMMTNHAGDRSYQPWSVEVINDETFDMRSALELWSSSIASHSTTNDTQRSNGATSNPNSYVGTGTVNQYGKDGVIVKQYTFQTIWPTDVGGIQLGWGQTDSVEVFPVTFLFDFFTVGVTGNIF